MLVWSTRHQHALVVLMPARSARSISGLTPIPITTGRTDRVAVLERDFRSSIAANALLQMENHAVAFVQTTQIFTHLRSENSLHRHASGATTWTWSFWNQRAATSIAMKLGHQHDAPGLGEFAMIARQSLRSAVTDLRRVRAGIVSLPARARRQKQRIKFAIAAIGELDALPVRIDRCDRRITGQFDLVSR